jgi:ParB-like chromosome segregation protein Spo0J
MGRTDHRGERRDVAMSEIAGIRVGAYQLMPDMTSEEFAALKADIAERGVVTPIDVDETGSILDGHHRYRAWRELQRNEPPPIIVRAGLSEAEKRSFAIRQNVHRRHLTRTQMQDLIERELKARPDHSSRRIAADLGVDHKTIGRLRRALAATGELPQLDATVGADGRSRRTIKVSAETVAFAKAFGGKIGADNLPDEMKLAFFKAGVPANSVVTISKPFSSEPDLSAEQIRGLNLFGQLLETKCKWSKEAIGDHLDWMIRNEWSPDTWLGEPGERLRRRWGMREPSDELKGWWRDLKSKSTAAIGPDEAAE